jgi:hypothetical protein
LVSVAKAASCQILNKVVEAGGGRPPGTAPAGRRPDDNKKHDKKGDRHPTEDLFECTTFFFVDQGDNSTIETDPNRWYDSSLPSYQGGGIHTALANHPSP